MPLKDSEEIKREGARMQAEAERITAERNSPERLAAISAAIAASNENYRRSTLLSSDPASTRFSGEGSGSAFAPGGTLYNSPTGTPFVSRSDERATRLAQGEERLALERAKAETLEANRDRAYRLDASKFASSEGHNALKLRRENDIHEQAADFWIAARELDPGSSSYPSELAALLKPRTLALEHPEIQKFLARNDSVRAKHLEIVGKGGASEFSGPAAAAYDREIQATGSEEKARAHALAFQKGEDEVKALFASGDLKAGDVDWGTEKDAMGNDIPVARTKNQHFVTDPNSPHFGEVDHSKLVMTGNRRKGEAAKAKVEKVELDKIVTEASTQLKTAYGITPAQLRNPLSVKAGRIGDDGSFTNAGFVDDKKNPDDVIAVDVGKKDAIVMPRREFTRQLAIAALDDPEATEAHKAAARKALGK